MSTRAISRFRQSCESQDRALTQIRATGGRVTIGAGVTFAQILRERELAFLHAPARSIGGPAVRNMGTVGGNLFAPSPFGDLATALLALDATVSVQGGYGTARDVDRGIPGGARSKRRLACPRRFLRASGERRRLSLSQDLARQTAWRLGGVASRLCAQHGRAGCQARASPMARWRRRAIRAKAAERALEGRTLDERASPPPSRPPREGASPATDAIASAWYRREVVGVHLRRVLLGLDA